ncbi:MAG: hypothetical protein AAFY74_05415 [Pseudomonadota bacterium]
MAEQLIEITSPCLLAKQPTELATQPETEMLRKLLSLRNRATAAQIQERLDW